MSDLISRSALKKALKSNCTPEICHDYGTNWCEACCLHNWFEDLIDNAPTVEMPKALGTVDENGNIKIELLRPQGEWKFKKFDEKTGIPNSDWCPFCGMVKAQVYDNFCGNCGADMRGGVE